MPAWITTWPSPTSRDAVSGSAVARGRRAAQRLRFVGDVAGLQRVLQVLLSRQGRQTLHVVVHPEEHPGAAAGRRGQDALVGLHGGEHRHRHDVGVDAQLLP